MQLTTISVIFGLAATILAAPAAHEPSFGSGSDRTQAGTNGIGGSFPIGPGFEPNQCYCCPTYESTVDSGLCGAIDFETKATTCAEYDNVVCCGHGICNSVPVDTETASDGGVLKIISGLAQSLDLNIIHL